MRWWLKQLLPLRYTSRYRTGDGAQRRAKWRMWFGRCFGITDVAMALMLCIGVAGCAPNTEPIERAANVMMEKVVGPAVEKAASELSERSAQLQGQASFITPGYVFSGYGIFGTGFVWEGTVRLVGVSANLAGATQADQGPDLADPLVEELEAVVEPADEPAEP